MTDPMAQAPHAPGGAPCRCCPPRPGMAGRRAAFGLIAAGLGLVAGPRGAGAASGRYEAMLLNCIDPRFTTHGLFHMAEIGLRDRYSQFVVAGGPIGAVHPHFAAWHDTFWQNLAVSVQLHAIRRVVAVTHRDCGAARIALGEAAVATRAAETAAHAGVLRAFRAAVGERQPGLEVVAGVMDLDGSVERVG